MAADQNREANDAPLDPASFIQSLPASLRQQVLADMDDSMVAVLPSDLATEANVLRREVEERHRRLVQERLFAQGAGLLSGILRHSGNYCAPAPAGDIKQCCDRPSVCSSKCDRHMDESQHYAICLSHLLCDCMVCLHPTAVSYRSGVIYFVDHQRILATER